MTREEPATYPCAAADDPAALLTRCDPALARVRDRLLAAGGTAVVLAPDPPAAVRRLLAAGRFFAGQGTVRIPLAPDRAGANVATLHRLVPDLPVAAGYALAADGRWRRHAWGLLGAEVVETTPAAPVLYFGYPLSPEETATVCWASPAPRPAARLVGLPSALHVERVRRTLLFGETLLSKR